MAVSVVSHGHGAMLHEMLHALSALHSPVITRVVVTLNMPEPDPPAPPQGWPFALQIIRNVRRQGFGMNHNQALADAREALVCILNPDVSWGVRDPFAVLARVAMGAGVGCAYPEQRNAADCLQDCERELPTPQALWMRYIRGRVETRVDWVNGACMVLPRQAWEAVGGFDEGYFMYCEDVDLCLRLRLAGLALTRAPVQVRHDGQRASHRGIRALGWHIRSLLRLWRSPAYREARRLLRETGGSEGRIGAP